MEFAIIIKKLKNQLSEEEKQEFDKWYSESEDHKMYFEKVRVNFTCNNSLVNEEKAWINVRSQIKNKNKRSFKWIYAYAAIFIALLGTALFYTSLQESPLSTTTSPVENAIVLTTEDGTEIDLTSGKAYRSKTIRGSGKQLQYMADSITPSKISYNSLTIPRGELFKITLSDNTIIWLNSDTKIKYPVSFKKGEPRYVEVLYGEAFFEVSPSSENNGMNFFVKTGSQTLEVLGTEFNVKAYKEDNRIITTLAEGEVVLSTPLSRNKKSLEPGFQSIYNSAKVNWVVREVDVNNEISWKNGVFTFKDKELKEIMMTLSRWYDVEVEFSTKSLETLEFNGVIRRTQNLNNILTILQETGKLEYEIVNQKITIKDKAQMERNQNE